MAAQILRLRRTDQSNQNILLHISQTRATKSLNLKLVGTEHEHLYHAIIKESSVKSLQASNYSGDLPEWQDILRYALVHERPSGSLPESLQGLETVAAISGNTLTVTLRKNIGGIVQRLGSIKLDQDDQREEVSPFDWVDTAVANGEEIRRQLEILQASVAEQHDEIAKLGKQLDELVKAKKEHESELLKKFAALLNTKKLKIRDQQRLLAGAKVDSEVAKAVRDLRGNGGRARSSRSGKRKADETVEEEDEVSDIAGEGEEERQEETPSQSDQEAPEDEEDMEAFAPAASNSNMKDAVLSSASAKTANGGNMDVDETEALPLRRELAFAKKNAAPSKQPEPPADEDDDDTDDEL